MENGWIKIHRKILNWEWYDDLKTFKLFMHCVLKANHIAKNWRGIEIKRGDFITSYENLKKETGLSIQNIRTILARLKLTGEITRSSSSKYTIITMVNYDAYQPSNTRTNKRLTNDQQTTNKQLTTTKNEKNEKNEKKYNKGKDVQKELLKILKHYNITFSKNTTSTRGFKKNYEEYWRNIHDMEKIKIAILNARDNKFWRDKMTLMILFRRKNSNGEDVDYIEHLSSRDNEQEDSGFPDWYNKYKDYPIL